MRSIREGFALAVAAAVAAGCGGGGSSATTGAGDGTVTQNLSGYGISATYQAKAGVQPQVSGSNTVGAAFTGLYGVNFTMVQANQQPTLANTKIAYSSDGNFWYADPFLTATTQVTNRSTFSNTCYPAISPNGRILAMANNADNQQLYFVSIDGSSFTKITSLALPCNRIAWNSSGNKCAFDSGGQIYTVNSSGSGLTNISNDANTAIGPLFSKDGTKIYYWQFNSGSGAYDTWVMNANGSGKAQRFGSALLVVQGQSISPDGTWIVASDGANLYRERPGIAGGFLVAPSGHQYQSPTFSPDGKEIAFVDSSASTTYIAEIDQFGSSFRDVLAVEGDLESLNWSTYPQNRQLVGTSGNVASGASGFILGETGDTVSSFVAFTATTPTTASIVPQAQTSDNCVFQLKGDSITKLAFVNDAYGNPTTVVPVTGMTTIGGAIVSFGTDSGKVVLVLPFAPGAPKMAPTKAGTQLTYTGKFPALFNNAGKNVAPHGASVVVIDSKSGKLVSWK